MWSKYIKIILFLVITVQVVSCWREILSYSHGNRYPRRYGRNNYHYARTTPYRMSTRYWTPHRYSFKGRPSGTYGWRTHFTNPVCTSYKFPINQKIFPTNVSPVTDSSVDYVLPQFSRVKPTIVGNGRETLPKVAAVTSSLLHHDNTFPHVTHSPGRTGLAYPLFPSKTPSNVGPVTLPPQDYEFHNGQPSTEKSFQVASEKHYPVHNKGAYPLFPRKRPIKDQEMTYAPVPQEDAFAQVSRETPTKDIPATYSPSRNGGTYPVFSRETVAKTPGITQEVPLPQEDVLVQVSRGTPTKDVPVIHSPSRHEDAYPLFPRDRPIIVPGMTHSPIPQKDVFVQSLKDRPTEITPETYSSMHNSNTFYPLLNRGKSTEEIQLSPQQVPSTGMFASADIVKVPILHIYDRRVPTEDQIPTDGKETFPFVESA